MKTKSKTTVKKGKVTTKKLKSPIADFLTPTLEKVNIEIQAVDPIFMPVYNDKDEAEIRVIIPGLNSQMKQQLSLNHRSVEVLDCGLNIKLPAGYQLSVTTRKEWANRGLLVSSVFLDNGRLKITVVNIGKENPLVINHKDSLAILKVNPVYLLKWN